LSHWRIDLCEMQVSMLKLLSTRTLASPSGMLEVRTR
jgi:hypothetical protein